MRASVVGLGLVGGSVGLGLRARGWQVSGQDLDEARAAEAVARGVVDRVGPDPDADLTVVATPVRAVIDAARAALSGTRGIVTDVGSVKGPIVEALDDPRFVGGHPMAGSEQDGLEGARAELFEGATWVLTPTGRTDDSAYTQVRTAISSLGAEVVSLDPARHDRLVAVVSHVPHLTAATLMGLADERAEEHRALLRLAAGGFRDMTRVAAGSPAIWPDICGENREAIVDVLDHLIDGLTDIRETVHDGDRTGLLEKLERANSARANLPVRFGRPDDLRELRVPVPDRPGTLAEVTTLATDLDINIVDLEIAHSSEGERGVLILVVEAATADHLREALVERGFHAAVHAL